MRDNRVKALSVLAGHADHIRDGIRYIVGNFADQTLNLMVKILFAEGAIRGNVIRRGNEYHRKPEKLNIEPWKTGKSFVMTDSEIASHGEE